MWNGKFALLETMHPSPHMILGFDFNRTAISTTKSGNGAGVGMASEVGVCVAAMVAVGLGNGLGAGVASEVGVCVAAMVAVGLGNGLGAGVLAKIGFCVAAAVSV